MLTHITIKNFILVEELNLDVKAHMTVLTGETGAGKSILLGAIELALGGRTVNKVVRPNSDRCDIYLEFNIEENNAAQSWLHNNDLTDDNNCILRRTINNDGRSRMTINGRPVPQQQVRELASHLLNMHGQHEHHLLLKPEVQLNCLDGFAQHPDLLNKVRMAYDNHHKLAQELRVLQAQENQTAEIDLLEYQLAELEQLAIKPDEYAQLEQEHKLLTQGENIRECCETILQWLNDNEYGAEKRLYDFQNKLSTFANFDKRLADCHELLRDANVYLQEANNGLNHYIDTLAFDPQQLHIIEQRMVQIHDVARKHHVQPEQLPTLQTELQNKLQALKNRDEKIQQCNDLLDKAREDYLQWARKLSASRQTAAKQLSKAITEKMQDLSMAGGAFKIDFLKNKDEIISVTGTDKIQFLVTANPGHPLQPLNKIASGGELSRISLAIQVLMAKNTMTPTLIFDEVDVGIGGTTAAHVGQALAELGKNYQILCITHLPQVAVHGEHHWHIRKHTKGNHTYTEIIPLVGDERVKEIARMVGGKKISKQTLAHAEEMLNST